MLLGLTPTPLQVLRFARIPYIGRKGPGSIKASLRSSEWQLTLTFLSILALGVVALALAWPAAVPQLASQSCHGFDLTIEAVVADRLILVERHAKLR